MERYLPRGVRNNNPGNIERDGTVWRGMAPDQSGDSRFVVFLSPLWGLRALAKVLLSYEQRHGLHSVAAMIGRWAPPGENDTASYAAHVASALGVSPDAKIDMDAPTLGALVRAIVAHENANYSYPPGLVGEAVDMALAEQTEV